MSRISRTIGRLAAIAAAAAALCPTARAADPKPKILFLTHSQGFKHSSLETAEGVFKEIGKNSGAYEGVTLEGFKQNQTAIDLSMITPAYLNEFAAVMFFTTGELPFTDEQKQALIDFIQNGKAWIGAHSAADTFYKWPAYAENFSGAYFKTHGAGDKPLILRVEDQKHPATKMLGAEFTWIDEFYQYKPESISRDRIHVLISVDTEKSDLGPQRGMEKGGDYPLAWCREVGKGRSFYTALGHREDVWTNPLFQAHLLGGIKWALGQEPGDATPSNAKK